VPIAIALLLAALAALCAASMAIGAGVIGPGRVLDFVLDRPGARADEQLRLVVVDLRLPRTVAALLVGAALGVAGALLQSATRNPLAEAGLLGVNAGAALGVVLGILIAGVATSLAYAAFALAGALLASAFVVLAAGAGRGAATPLRLVLVGAALSATLQGLTSALLMRDPATFDQYRFWVLGSLSGVDGPAIRQVAPFLALGFAIAALSTRPLSALALGDDAARALGHRPRAIRLTVVCAVALLAGGSVALAGPIAFLGLVAPYAARTVCGPALGAQLGLSALLGAAILLAADIAGRVIVRPGEAPVAVLLALIGGPLLVWIARSRRARTLRLVGASP
jgi:iron complex transport system permease protein